MSNWGDFDRRHAEMQQGRARMGRDHEEMKREMARSHRRWENVFVGCAWALMGGGVFLLWLLYHILKTKGLVP